MPAGRPSGYTPKFHIPWVRSLARRGLTVKEIADEIGVAKSTLCKWVSENPDLSDALNEGRDIADSVVEESLYRLACGHTVQTKKTIVSAGKDGDQKPARIEIVEQEVSPNATACIFWLKNRKRMHWTDRQEVQLEASNDSETDVVIVLPHNHRQEHIEGTVEIGAEE